MTDLEKRRIPLAYEIITICLPLCDRNCCSLLLTISDRLGDATDIHKATLSQLNCMPTLIAIVLIMIRNVMLIMQMLIMKSNFLCVVTGLFYGHHRLPQHDLDRCQNK